MSGRLVAALRGNPHALNFTLLSLAFIVPLTLYSLNKTPDAALLETVLREKDSPGVARAAASTARINEFWKGRRTSHEMEDVYAGLLRQGRGGLARQHELTGTLAALEVADTARTRAGSVATVAVSSAAAVAVPGAVEPSAATVVAPSAAVVVAPSAATAAVSSTK